MLISSVWRGESRRYFIGGLLVGGTLAGATLVLLGALVFQWWVPTTIGLWVSIGVGAVAIARDAGVLTFKLPQNARQVPEMVGSSGPRQGALQFGIEMGTGARTYMTSMLPFVPLAFIVLAAPWSVALLCGLAFGIGRATVPAVRSLKENDMSWSERFELRERHIQVALDVSVLAGLVLLAT